MLEAVIRDHHDVIVCRADTETEARTWIDQQFWAEPDFRGYSIEMRPVYSADVAAPRPELDPLGVHVDNEVAIGRSLHPHVTVGGVDGDAIMSDLARREVDDRGAAELAVG